MQIARSLLFFLVVFISSCSDDQKSSAPAKPDKDTASKTFFPVTDYIRGQLSQLDSSETAPVKIITENGKSDSAWLKREDIRPFAQPFLSPEIDSIHLSEYFTSTSFLDQTIAAFTFAYDPVKSLPDNMPLRRWDIYIDPETNEVKRIFIVKETNGEKKHLTWTPGWCMITTINGDKVKEEKMIWRF